MTGRQRAIMLTGLGFPLGAVLGLLLARYGIALPSTSGFADIVLALTGFIFGGPVLSLLLFAAATRGMDVASWAQTWLRMLIGAIAATAVVFVGVVGAGRGLPQVFILVALAMGAWLMGSFAKKALP